MQGSHARQGAVAASRSLTLRKWFAVGLIVSYAELVTLRMKIVTILTSRSRHIKGFVGGVVIKIDIVLLLWVERDRIGMGCSNL